MSKANHHGRIEVRLRVEYGGRAFEASASGEGEGCPELSQLFEAARAQMEREDPATVSLQGLKAQNLHVGGGGPTWSKAEDPLATSSVQMQCPACGLGYAVPNAGPCSSCGAQRVLEVPR